MSLIAHLGRLLGQCGGWQKSKKKVVFCVFLQIEEPQSQVCLCICLSLPKGRHQYEVRHVRYGLGEKPVKVKGEGTREGRESLRLQCRWSGPWGKKRSL